jgi:glycosyltransferase involved in cell wall biosynthesis
MRKILVITERYWPEGGGGALVTHLVLKRILQLSNVKIAVLTETENPEKLNGVEYIYAPLSGASKYHAYLKQMMLLLKESFKSFLQKFHLIYIPDHSYLFIPICKRLRKKVIVHLHDYQPICASSVVFASNDDINLDRLLVKENLTYELIQQRGYRKAILSVLASPLNNVISSSSIYQADTIICVSYRQAQLILKGMSFTGSLIRSKLRIMHNPLPNDIPFIGLREVHPNFVYVGGGNIAKGIYLLIKAFINLKKKEPSKNITLTLLDMMPSKEWERWHRSNVNWCSIFSSLNKGIGCGIFKPLPRLTRRDLIKLYSVSRGLVYPTLLEEPSPCAITEALLTGRPVIAPSIGGIPELVAGTLAESYLYNSTSLEGLTDKLEKVSALSAQEISDLGVALRDQIKQKFKDEQLNDHIRSIFEL